MELVLHAFKLPVIVVASLLFLSVNRLLFNENDTGINTWSHAGRGWVFCKCYSASYLIGGEKTTLDVKMGRQSSWWEAELWQRLQPFLSPSLGGTCAWSPEGPQGMDEAGLQPGGSFLLGFLIFCTLFALQAAEKSSGWWDCWLTLESPTGEFGRAVRSPWIKKSPEGALCLSRLLPG